jgi:SAM-dependent methyltransferase
VRGDDSGIAEAFASLVLPRARVLALGCAGGETLRLLHAHGCRVVAVETPNRAEAAAPWCERVLTSPLEAATLDAELGSELFDVAVTDAVERLRDAAEVLKALQKHLRPGGYLVATLDNVAYAGLRLALWHGRLPGGARDEAAGPLVRLYDRAALQELFDGAGWRIDHLEREEQALEEAATGEDAGAPPELLAALRQDPEAQTRRFTVVASPANQAAPGLLFGYVRRLAAEKGAAEQALAALAQTVEQQAERVRELAARIDELSRGGQERGEAAQIGAELRVAVERQGEQMSQLVARVEALSRHQTDGQRGAAQDRSWHDDEVQGLLRSLQSSLATARSAHPALRTTDRHHYVEYQQLIHRIRGIVCAALPDEATVVVVSRGDDALLALDGRMAWHFPQDESGVYAGYYPADSAAAIAHLEALRARGGQFLLFPATSLWWLDHYTELAQYLDDTYRRVVRHEDTCVIYDLRTP